MYTWNECAYTVSSVYSPVSGGCLQAVCPIGLQHQPTLYRQSRDCGRSLGTGQEEPYSGPLNSWPAVTSMEVLAAVWRLDHV